MRRFQLVPLVVLLLACGGTAARNTKPSPSVAGAAGELNSAAGSASVVTAGAGGDAGHGSAGGAGAAAAAGAVAAAGAAAAGGAEANDAGAGGQAGAPGCVGLDCLAGAEALYVPDREWQHTGAASGTGELLEADYEPFLGPTWRAKFSSDALALDLTPTAGGDTVHGTRDPKRAASAWFDLERSTGGRFVVQARSSELHAEHTMYGSGVPIVSSTRGLLKSP